jgi:hypothetical protein
MGTTSKKSGRKSLHPDGSGTLVVRVGVDLLARIDRLATRQKKDRSVVVRDALRFWISQHRLDVAHIGGLTSFIEILIGDIERRTGKRWDRDPLTGAAVRELVADLIFHLAPTPAKPLTVPSEIREALSHLIIRYENPPHPASQVIDERAQALAVLMREIGSGFQRNRKVWLKRKKEGGL